MSYPTKQLDLVKFILERSPEARDNDNILLWIVWKKEYPIIDNDIEEFKKLFISKQLPSMESITRARRKLQEVYPELRGLKYDKRQNNQKLYKEDLGYNASRH
tara:strand:- start:1140 stop:1448 length:309 start_codon:yes stop_codon:yes gene_type:complete